MKVSTHYGFGTVDDIYAINQGNMANEVTLKAYVQQVVAEIAKLGYSAIATQQAGVTGPVFIVPGQWYVTIAGYEKWPGYCSNGDVGTMTPAAKAANILSGAQFNATFQNAPAHNVDQSQVVQTISATVANPIVVTTGGSPMEQAVLPIYKMTPAEQAAWQQANNPTTPTGQVSTTVGGNIQTVVASGSKTDYYLSLLQESDVISGVPNWAILAAAALGLYMLSLGGGGRR